MNLLEKFIIDYKSPWKSAFASGGGDDVNMKPEEIILFSIIPFGQTIMRIWKYNGSLDKMYLLLLEIASIKFILQVFDTYEHGYGWNVLGWYLFMVLCNSIPAIMGKFELLNKVEENQGDVFDPPILLPLVVRFIFGFFMVYISFVLGPLFGGFLTHFVLFMTTMLAVFIRLATRKQCNSRNKGSDWHRFLKVLTDTMFIYSFVFLASTLVTSIQKFSGLQNMFSTPVPYYGNMGNFILMIGWIIGVLVGYVLNNMIDLNFNTNFYPPYEDDDVCKGEVSALKGVLTIVLLIASIGIYVYSTRLNAPTMMNLDQSYLYDSIV